MKRAKRRIARISLANVYFKSDVFDALPSKQIGSYTVYEDVDLSFFLGNALTTELKREWLFPRKTSI